MLKISNGCSVPRKIAARQRCLDCPLLQAAWKLFMVVGVFPPNRSRRWELRRLSVRKPNFLSDFMTHTEFVGQQNSSLPSTVMLVICPYFRVHSALESGELDVLNPRQTLAKKLAKTRILSPAPTGHFANDKYQLEEERRREERRKARAKARFQTKSNDAAAYEHKRKRMRNRTLNHAGRPGPKTVGALLVFPQCLGALALWIQ